MKDRRLLGQRTTPAHEDSGLFKKSLVRVRARLLPEVQRTLRQDLLVRALMNEEQEVIVIFAGRRTKQVAPLIKQLTQLRARNRQLLARNPNGGREADQLHSIHVEVEGSWRVKFTRDVEGWENRDFQLMAARWRLLEKGLHTSFSGSLPVRQS